MKSIIKILISCVAIILVFYVWNEFSDLSLSKKINDQKMSSFFTAISSMLTAVTVFLLYKQITELIENRKSSNRPDLYPEDQFFTMHLSEDFPTLKRDNNEDRLSGLISLHNIGLGAAKEITVKWYFKKDLVAPLIKPSLEKLYTNRKTEENYSFVLPKNKIDIQLPLMYLASLASFKEEWSEVIWEDLFLEISYKDIHDYPSHSKIFSVTTYVGKLFVSFKFTPSPSIKLSEKSMIKSTALI